MCNYHIQTVKRHFLGQTATCAVHLCVRGCVCVRLSAKMAPLLVSKYHIFRYVAAYYVVYLYACVCVCLCVAER